MGGCIPYPSPTHRTPGTLCSPVSFHPLRLVTLTTLTHATPLILLTSHPPTIDHFPPATTDDCQELLNGWLLGWRSGLVGKG